MPVCQVCFTSNVSKKGVFTIYEVFKAEVVKQKRLRKLTNADIAKMTGYARITIDIFMTSTGNNPREDSKNVAEAISKALGIEL